MLCAAPAGCLRFCVDSSGGPLFCPAAVRGFLCPRPVAPVIRFASPVAECAARSAHGLGFQVRLCRGLVMRSLLSRGRGAAARCVWPACGWPAHVPYAALGALHSPPRGIPLRLLALVVLACCFRMLRWVALLAVSWVAVTRRNRKPSDSVCSRWVGLRVVRSVCAWRILGRRVLGLL